MITPVTLLLVVLGVWRITHLLGAEDGPWGVLASFRHAVPSGVFDCFYCLSLWTAAPFAIAVGSGWGDRLLLWLASSGGAILLERLTGDRPSAAVSVAYFEEGLNDGVLRSTQDRTDERDPVREPRRRTA